MKKLLNDWVDLLWTPQITFIKRHWVFYILCILASVIYSICIVYPSLIANMFDKIKQKNDVFHIQTMGLSR